MRKLFVLDTSVLVSDPYSFKSFTNSDVIIPINVIDELDKLKTFPNEAGKNARVCVRALDKICSQGSIHKGIIIEGDILLKIDVNQYPNKFGPSTYVDNKILACAYALSKKRKCPVTLISKDINLRIRARAFDILAEDYSKEKTSISELYTGFREVYNTELGNLLKAGKDVNCSSNKELKEMCPNECVSFMSDTFQRLAIGRKVGNVIKPIRGIKPWRLETKNIEQAYAIDLLCDPKVPLVTLTGRAGVGKTLIAIASALELVLERKLYNKLIVYRPIQAVGGKDLGYLPGSLDEKLNPWMQAIYDSFEFLLSTGRDDKWKMMFDLYREKQLIQLDAITYIRGRSIPNALILIDEAQNISREEVKTLLTRASDGTKVILTGDIEQIDNNNLDAMNNGLTYALEAFKVSPLAGHISLVKGERSELATEASRLL